MGCCASKSHRAVSVPQHLPCHLKTVPPPEEETVKEVLSEVPAPKPTAPAIGDEKNFGSRSVIRETQQKELKMNVDKTAPLQARGEVSEVSEICSLNASVSSVMGKREYDREVRKVVGGSPARSRRERVLATAGKSLASRPDPCPSPGRVRSSPGREMRGMEGKRWDCGEVSGRRARSPATRAVETGAARAGLGGIPSVRKTGKSPGRGRSELSDDKTRKIGDSNRETTEWSPPTTSESLENPLVSLECFIFL